MLLRIVLLRGSRQRATCSVSGNFCCVSVCCSFLLQLLHGLPCALAALTWCYLQLLHCLPCAHCSFLHQKRATRSPLSAMAQPVDFAVVVAQQLMEFAVPAEVERLRAQVAQLEQELQEVRRLANLAGYSMEALAHLLLHDAPSLADAAMRGDPVAMDALTDLSALLAVDEGQVYRRLRSLGRRHAFNVVVINDMIEALVMEAGGDDMDESTTTDGGDMDENTTENDSADNMEE